MSSSTSAVGGETPRVSALGRGAKIDAMSEIDTTFHLLRQIGSGNRNT